jgi:hypothetical protein
LRQRHCQQLAHRDPMIWPRVQAPVNGHSAQSHSEKAEAGSFLCAHSNQKISGHHGALVAWKIASACATAPETSS